MTSDGKVLAQGAIRVDARRAVAKLREHLLVDLHGYIHELARAAVLANATRLQVHYDADDLYVRFDGAACSPSEAEHLLDYALSAPDDDTGRRLRMLALGVNAALGLRPSFVDVYTAAKEGQIVRVRFEPDRLDNAEEEVSLASEVDTRMPPDERGVLGTCIHIRRKWGWGVVLRAVTREAPPEVRLLAATTRRVSIPVEIGDLPVERDAAYAPLVSCTVPGRWRAGVELIAPTSGPPVVEFLENEVKLLAMRWGPWDQADAPQMGQYFPLRGFVDAKALPTNASRSALREDPRITATMQTLSDALGHCLSGAAAVLTGQAVDERVEVHDVDLEKLGRAFGVATSFVLRAILNGVHVPPAACAFGAWPLLRDGVGAPLTPSAVIQAIRHHGRVYVSSGDEPFPQDHAPWMKRVVWLHAPHAEAMLSGLPRDGVERILDEVRTGVKRRNRLMASAPAAPHVPPLVGELLRESFHVEKGELAGLRGELCVLDPAKHHGARLRYYVEDRMLEADVLPQEVSGLAMEAAIAWDGHIIPTMGYDAVERNAPLQHAIQRVMHLAILGLANLCSRANEAGGGDGARLYHAVRLAFAGDPGFAWTTALRDVPAWQTASGHPVSLTTLTAKGGRPVCTVTAQWLGDRTMSMPDQRPVLVTSPDDHGALTKALQQKGLACVPYEAWLTRAQDYDSGRTRESLRTALEAELSSQGAPVQVLVPFEAEGQFGYIAPSPVRRALRHHLGIRASSTPRPLGLGKTSIAIEDHTLIASPSGTGIEWSQGLPSLLAADNKLCEVVIALVESKVDWDADGASCSAPPAVLAGHPFLRAFLLSAAVDIRAHRAEYGSEASVMALLERIVSLPLWTWLDGGGNERPTSLREVQEAHRGKVTLVSASASLTSAPTWAVLYEGQDERALLESWFATAASRRSTAVYAEKLRGSLGKKADGEPPTHDRVDIDAVMSGAPLLPKPRVMLPVLSPPTVTPSPEVEDHAGLATISDMISEVLGSEEDDADPLGGALRHALRRLPGAPRCAIKDAEGGRVIRFSAKDNTLYVRRDDPALKLAREGKSRHALRAVTAAAMAELNRELDAVTDAEERRALAELFQAWEAGS